MKMSVSNKENKTLSSIELSVLSFLPNARFHDFDSLKVKATTFSEHLEFGKNSREPFVSLTDYLDINRRLCERRFIEGF